LLLRETHRATIEALKAPRYEIVPIRGVIDQVVHLPRSATLTVTCSPSHGIEPTIGLVEQLSAMGFTAVPHLSARRVLSEDHVAEIIERLTRAGVHDVYVIGGDAGRFDGPFTTAGELIHALNDHGDPFSEIGIAAYPEGHPLVDDEIMWKSLLEKQWQATYIVTQMCFDPEAIGKWVTEARERGISLPVLAGIPGVASKAHLLRVASRIGVGESARFLARHAGMLSRLVRPGNFQPDDLVDDLTPYLADSTLDIRGFHIYTFNYVTQTEDWRRRRLAGDRPY
jgi:methylenetetrahydrofolate reductase (NADPH)